MNAIERIVDPAFRILNLIGYYALSYWFNTHPSTGMGQDIKRMGYLYGQWELWTNGLASLPNEIRAKHVKAMLLVFFILISTVYLEAIV